MLSFNEFVSKLQNTNVQDLYFEYCNNVKIKPLNMLTDSDGNIEMINYFKNYVK